MTDPTNTEAEAAKFFKRRFPEELVHPRFLWPDDPELADEATESWEARVRTALDWGVRHKLRPSPGCCPTWLARGTPRRCYFAVAAQCVTNRPSWLQRPVFWTHAATTPAAITVSVPGWETGFFYRPELDRLITQNTNLRWHAGPGWYHSDTTQITVWRSDVLGGHGEVATADAGRALNW